MRRLRYLKRDFKNNWDLYLLAIPLIAYYVIFCYGPMYGLKIAFMDYNPWKGMSGSAYAGLKHFRNFLSLSTSRQYIVNTLRISLTSLVLSYPLPILLALMLNTVRSTAARRIFQSISYLPHFLSWIVIASLVRSMFSTSTGAVNQVIKNLGMEPINFLGSGKYFRGVLVLSDCWKEIGWGSIIYLAALMGVDADTLVKSVETYNTACATGNDTEFGKGASNLTAIDAAPYYAVRIYVCTGGTIAGVKTNLDFQVLREDGSVINGLYAGGETSNREMYAYAYSSGSGVGYALASGRQIGMNLMK